MDLLGCEPTVLSCNTIMNILVEYGYTDQSHKVYLRMLEKGIIPDVYTFTVRINSFCRTRRPQPLGYLGTYQKEGMMLMQSHTAMLFVVCLKKTSRKGDVFESSRLLAKVMKRGLFFNLYAYNILIQGLCRVFKIKEAISLLELLDKDLTPDVIICNTLISGLCKNSKVDEAESYLHEMVNRGCFPDDFTHNTTIDGYCKSARVQNACFLLKDAIFKGFVPDRVTYCSLVNGLCEEGDINRAIKLFNEALTKGFTPDAVLYNSLFKGLYRQ